MHWGIHLLKTCVIFAGFGEACCCCTHHNWPGLCYLIDCIEYFLLHKFSFKALKQPFKKISINQKPVDTKGNVKALKGQLFQLFHFSFLVLKQKYSSTYHLTYFRAFACAHRTQLHAFLMLQFNPNCYFGIKLTLSTVCNLSVKIHIKRECDYLERKSFRNILTKKSSL